MLKTFWTTFSLLKISLKPRWKTTDKKQKESRSNFNLEVQDKHKLCSSANPCKFTENWTNKIKSLSDFILCQKKLKQLKLNEISNFKRICNRLRKLCCTSCKYHKYLNTNTVWGKKVGRCYLKEKISTIKNQTKDL